MIPESRIIFWGTFKKGSKSGSVPSVPGFINAETRHSVAEGAGLPENVRLGHFLTHGQAGNVLTGPGSGGGGL